MIYTSFWSGQLPPNHIRIGISRGTPRWMKVQPRITELAPGSWLYTVADDTEEFRSRYVSQLGALDPVQVVERIHCEAAGKTPVLTCFCKPGVSNWCHRSWVSVWLAHRAGLQVPELGMEEQGCAASHPLLPAAYRRPVERPQSPTRPVQLDLL